MTDLSMMTTTQAAAYITEKSGKPISGISIRRLCSHDVIPAVKLDMVNRWIIDAKDLNEYILKRSQAGYRKKGMKLCSKCKKMSIKSTGYYINLQGKLRRAFICEKCSGKQLIIQPS